LIESPSRRLLQFLVSGIKLSATMSRAETLGQSCGEMTSEFCKILMLKPGPWTFSLDLKSSSLSVSTEGAA
jgi:hypothetical protein